MTRSLAVWMVLGIVACGGSQIRSEEPQLAPADTGPPDAGPSPALAEDAGVESVEVAPDAEVASADAGPGPADAETTPPADDVQALVSRGRRAYTRVCETCHEDGPRLVGRHLPEARVRQQVRQGGRRMRAIPPARLSESDLDALCVFLAAR